MNRKPICKCGHTATQHASVKYTNKKGETKHYKGCRVKDCDCKAYEPETGTNPPEFPSIIADEPKKE